jgi:hypothetical protein
MSWETCQICDAPLTGGFCSDQDCPYFNSEERVYTRVYSLTRTIKEFEAISPKDTEWYVHITGEDSGD